MEEQKNNEMNNEHSCCSHSEKSHAQCCSKHSCMHMFVKIFIIIVIFMLGICVGSRVSSHRNVRYFGKDFRNQGNCQMMRGENARCGLQNKQGLPIIDKTQKTTTTTK